VSRWLQVRDAREVMGRSERALSFITTDCKDGHVCFELIMSKTSGAHTCVEVEFRDVEIVTDAGLLLRFLAWLGQVHAHRCRCISYRDGEYVCVCVYVYVYVCVLCVCMNVCVCVCCMYVCMHVCMYVCMDGCMYVCMCMQHARVGGVLCVGVKMRYFGLACVLISSTRLDNDGPGAPGRVGGERRSRQSAVMEIIIMCSCARPGWRCGRVRG